MKRKFSAVSAVDLLSLIHVLTNEGYRVTVGKHINAYGMPAGGFYDVFVLGKEEYTHE